MITQTILWTALPNGFTDDKRRARLSIYVSPRLTTDKGDTLAPFDLVDWPARLANGAFECALEFGQPGGNVLSVNARIVSAPDSQRWKALFNAKTFVRTHETETLSRTYGSYPVAQLHDELKRSYQEVCVTSPLDRSSRKVVTTAFARLHELTVPQQPIEGSVSTMSATEARVEIARRVLEPDADGQRAARLDDLVDRAQNTALPAARFTSLVPDTGKSTDAFVKLAVFHEQPRGRPTITRARAPRDDRTDFHQQITLLGEYPQILRLLGLVIDVEVDLDQIPKASAKGPGRVRVVPTFKAALGVETEHLTPHTAYVFQRGETFAAAARDANDSSTETRAGFLNLRRTLTPKSKETAFRIVQVDVDSAGLRAIDLLGKAVQTPEEGVPDRSDAFALPPIRTAGISIVREGHAESLLNAIDASHSAIDGLQSGRAESKAAPLFQDDLTRGYRVDVRDGPNGTWRSLHARAGQYDFPSQKQLKLADEGCIQPMVSRPIEPDTADASATPDPQVPNYIPESLFLWQGWSLAARRPGKSMPDDTPVVRPPSVPDPNATLKLETQFSPVRGSLPKLRFGQPYELRARIVDVAGNSLSLDEADAVPEPPTLPLAGDSFVFRRFEPVPSPVLVLRHALRDGDAVERIVLRSTPTTTAEAFTKSHPEYVNSAERHVAPPKTGQLMAEMHGKFDASIGANRNAEADRMHKLASRESIALPEVHEKPAFSVGYLPDPIAAGASFRGLPGIPDGKVARVRGDRLEVTDLPLEDTERKGVGSLALIDFGASSLWPDQQPFRLKLVEGDGTPVWRAAERELSVAIPKGETRTVRIASHLRDDNGLGLLGIWQWMVDWLEQEVAARRLSHAESRAKLEDFRQRSLLGLWWMQTPYRELTLVHAVQQPLVAPVIASFSEPLKLANRTFVYIQGRVDVDIGSTGKLDLLARWVDKSDEREVPQEAVVFENLLQLPTDRAVTYSFPPIEKLEADVQTKAQALGPAVGQLATAVRIAQGALTPPQREALNGVVSDARVKVAHLLSLTAEPSWPDLVTAAADLQPVQQLQDLTEPDIPNPLPSISPAIMNAGSRIETAAQALADSAATGIATLNRWPRQEFGDTKHRKVFYRAVGTTRFREYFAAESSDTFTQVSAESEVHILSTARPAAPTVRYLVPMFGWDIRKDAASGATVRHRRGGGLRVFLERPWFSSGDGELLGVIVEQTQCARDPIWDSGPAVSALTADHFPLRSETLSGLTLPGAGDVAVTVVGHAVQFDADRKLWFCDIEIDPGESYFPFVRLALVRFQPHSREGMHLSQVVIADWAQLAPSRTVTLDPVPASPDRFAVKVEGLTYRANAWHPGDIAGETGLAGLLAVSGTASPPFNPARSLVVVNVEQRIPNTTDDAGWLPVPADGGIAIEGVSVNAGSSASAAVPLWSGTVTLPPNRSAGQFRIVVREREHFLTDSIQIRRFKERFVDTPPDLPPGFEPPTEPEIVERTYYPGAPRLVFADAVVL